MKIKTPRKIAMLLIGLIIMAIAFFAGGLWQSRRPAVEPQASEHAHDHSEHTEAAAESASSQNQQMYTCSMHPQVRSPDPDEPCPICGMDLIPVPMDDDDADFDGDVPQLRLSPRAAALMKIRTWPAERADMDIKLQLFGRTAYDKSTLQDVVVQAPGYLETLPIKFKLQRISRGDLVAEIYSPEVVSAFQELLLAESRGGATLAAARARLLRLGVATEQIDEALESGELPRTYRVTSPGDGIVTELDVRTGSWVGEGVRLLQLADLATVWINLEVYESDLPWLVSGQEIHFTVQSHPGVDFSAVLDYIEPVLDPRKRTLHARATVDNRDGLLAPGTFVRAQVHTSAAAAMNDTDALPLLIPASAPLITGTRALVYVQLEDTERPTFEPREIILGPRAGDFYIVKEGLQEGELVVSHGQFKIDSELQIRGRPSMMGPAGGEPPAHDHGEASPAAAEEIQQMAAPTILRRHLGELVEGNFILAAALAADEATAAEEAAATLRAQLAAGPQQDLDLEIATAWTSLSEKMVAGLKAVAAESELSGQRPAFERFSNALTHAVRKFGVADMSSPVYQAMCPMVEGREGYWLQAEETINNPYHGEAMLHCGVIVDTLFEPETAD